MIETARLLLRLWRDADRAPYAAMTADPEVGYWLGGTLDEDQANAQIDRFMAASGGRGPGFLAVERRSDGAFVGAACLRDVPDGHPLSSEVEVGWRLARRAWGAGFATEAARGLLAQGFSVLGLPEIIAFTAVSNTRSRAVMDRLAFARRPQRDFDHPGLPAAHPLRRHVVYAITAQDFQASRSSEGKA
jgi:RimJ/RimL family protein N-acetyltransferase